MRSMIAQIGPLNIELAATFGAAAEIAKKVADPMSIAREAGLEAMMIQAGGVYHPRFSFTVENVPVILQIGAKASGENVTLEQMQEAVFDMGLLAAKEVAAEYLALIVTPRSSVTFEEEPAGGEDAAPGE